MKLHTITGTEHSNFTFTAEYEKNVVDGIFCINKDWFSIMNVGYWMLEIKNSSHSHSNHALILFEEQIFLGKGFFLQDCVQYHRNDSIASRTFILDKTQAIMIIIL